MVDYNNRFFRPVGNSPNGQADSFTLFRFRQQGTRVWGDYAGGPIEHGHFVAAVDAEGVLAMEYHHLTKAGEVRAGRSRSSPERLPDGRWRLKETWEWTSGDRSAGENWMEEVHQPSEFQTLQALEGEFAVCRLSEEADLSLLAQSRHWFSLTRTQDEISLVCPEALAPGPGVIEGGWTGFQVEGLLSFSQTGILANLSRSLAEDGISIFSVSTYNTDYIFVKTRDQSRARELWRRWGHKVG